MNVIAMISAIIGVVILSLTVFYGNKIKPKWLGYLVAIVGIVIALGVMGYVPALLGDKSLETAQQGGNYLGMLIITVVLIKYLFFRKKK